MPQENQNQKVLIYYLKEEHPYSLEKIAEKLHLPDDGEGIALSLMQKLREYKICSEVNDNNDKQYKFSFVGFAEFRLDPISSPEKKGENSSPNNISRIVFFLPKFLPEPTGNSSSELKEHCKMLLRAILKCDKEKNDVTPFSSNQIVNDDTLISSRLEKLLALVFDWMEHGTYLVEQSLLEENGEGEINWEETISQKLPSLQNRRPVYMEYLTQCKVEDSSHYITRLHEFLVSKCYKELDSLGLGDALGLFCEIRYDGELSDFGEDNYILSRLNGELGNQFIDTKRNTLNLMKAVVGEEFHGSNDLNEQFLGMKSFHTLWEAAIKDVYGDQLEQSIKPDILKDSDKNTNFAEYIDPPRWCSPERQEMMDADRLKPDFVAIEEKGEQKYMVILDAKYYLPEFTGTGIKYQPGVGDVNKQFLYQLAYKKLIELNELQVINAFIFPKVYEAAEMVDNSKNSTEADNKKVQEFKYFATIKVPMFAEWFDELNNQFQKASSKSKFPTDLASYEIDGLALLSNYEQHRKQPLPLDIFIKYQQTNEANAASPSS